jgi:hypothetical protein
MIADRDTILSSAISCWKSLIALESDGFINTEEEYDALMNQQDECKRFIDELYGAYPRGSHPVNDSDIPFGKSVLSLTETCMNALNVLLSSCETDATREVNRTVYEICEVLKRAHRHQLPNGRRIVRRVQ